MRSLPLVSLALVALIMLTAVSVNAQQDTTPPAERVGMYQTLVSNGSSLWKSIIVFDKPCLILPSTVAHVL